MPALKYRTKMPRPDDPEIIAAFCPAIRQGHPVRTTATPARRALGGAIDSFFVFDRVALRHVVSRQPYARLCPPPPTAV